MRHVFPSGFGLGLSEALRYKLRLVSNPYEYLCVPDLQVPESFGRAVEIKRAFEVRALPKIDPIDSETL